MKFIYYLTLLFSVKSGLAVGASFENCEGFIEKGRFIYSDPDFSLQNTKIESECKDILDPLTDAKATSVPFQALVCVISGTIRTHGKDKTIAVIVTKMEVLELQSPHERTHLGEFLSSDTRSKKSLKYSVDDRKDGFDLDVTDLTSDSFPVENHWIANFSKPEQRLKLVRYERKKGEQSWPLQYSITMGCRPIKN